MAVRRSLADDLAASLLQDILEGIYPAGSLLPPETVLTSQSGMSRPTVREAVKILQSKSVLTVRQGSGTQINPVDDWSPLDHTLLLARFSHNSSDLELPKQFIEARRLVEVGVAELAAGRRTEEDLADLESALADMRSASAAADVAQFVDADILFHQVVLDAAGNAFVSALFEPLGQILRVTRHQTSSHSLIREHAITQHARILEALRAGDPDGARKAMSDHMAQTERDIDTYLADSLVLIGAAQHPRDTDRRTHQARGPSRPARRPPA